MVNEERYREVRDEVLQRIHGAILRVSRERRHLLSRAAILPDHLHLLLGCRLEESPEGVALTYLNGLAEACGGKAVFKPSYFVGTLSEYDLGVIPRV